MSSRSESVMFLTSFAVMPSRGFLIRLVKQFKSSGTGIGKRMQRLLDTLFEKMGINFVEIGDMMQI